LPENSLMSVDMLSPLLAHVGVVESVLAAEQRWRGAGGQLGEELGRQGSNLQNRSQSPVTCRLVDAPAGSPRLTRWTAMGRSPRMPQ
jgi:hypothetical protein